MSAYKLPINNKWCEFDDTWVDRQKPHVKQTIRERIDLWEHNRLACMLPHGVPWHEKEKRYAGGKVILRPSTYPREWRNDGVAFLNDWTNDYSLMVAPRKTGKSYDGAAKVLLFGLNKEYIDPSWPLFTENGINYDTIPETSGPMTIAVASFSWKNVAELWEVYREIMPRDELGDYAPNWGKYPNEKGKQRNLSFRSNQTQEFYCKKSNLRLLFLCYTQSQASWENFKANGIHCDEQIPLEKLRAFQDGTRTMGDYTPAFFTLSGFTLPERETDTGSIGPIKRTIWDADEDDPRTIGRYNKDIPSTPDAVVSKKKKQDAYDIYVSPKVKRDKKTVRRALACYYPGWEPPSEAVFDPDVWDEKHHIISRLWDDDSTPKSFTLARSCDYCDKKITAVGWFATMTLGHLESATGVPMNDGVDKSMVVNILYRSIYEENMLVAGLVKQIVEMSHNERISLGTQRDFETGNICEHYRELQRNEQFYIDVLDSRIGAQRQQGEKAIELFERYGMTEIEGASGLPNADQIPALKDKMRIRWQKPHPWHKDDEGKPLMGCPCLFFIEGVADGIIDEIESIPQDTGTFAKSSPIIDKRYTHDGIDMLKYWASENVGWMGDDAPPPEPPPEGNKFTGY